MTLLPFLLVVASTAIAPPPIQSNDNARRAGWIDGGVLTVRLVAEMGTWLPNGPKGAAVSVAAFGEDGLALSVPGPLIRAVEGTTVVMTLRNALGSELRMR